MARATYGSVVGEVEVPDVGRNYYRVAVAYGDDTVTMLMNPAARLVACFEGNRPFPANASFLDVPDEAAFVNAGFSCASASEMEMALREKHLVGLTQEDVEQIRYYRPDRFGDVAFNWFD